MRRQRENSFAETPKKRRGCPKKAKIETKETVFKPNTEKAKLSLPPRKFGAAKFKEQTSLDRTLKGKPFISFSSF